ncbi:hypothetical protein ACKKBF_B36160 [Auxenochlorella protothecoides x Auxenochlorella symbiontica]
MALLTHELVPGRSLGPFVLGDSITHTMAYLQQHRKSYRRVEVQYEPQALLSRDILVTLPEHGLRLAFEPLTQRLRLLEILDSSHLLVTYQKARAFGGMAHPPCLGGMYDTFGPTYPVEWDPASASFPLLYPGLLLLFPVPPCDKAMSLTPGNDAPQRFPVPPTTQASRVCLFTGAARDAAAALASPPPPRGHPGAARVLHAVPGRGVYSEAGPGGANSACVELGDSPQDVVTRLGPPTFTSAAAEQRGLGARYVYMYPDLGMDVVMGARTHAVEKLVLHASMPGSAGFGLASRCSFRVYAPGTMPMDTPRARLVAGTSTAGGRSGEEPRPAERRGLTGRDATTEHPVHVEHAPSQGLDLLVPSPLRQASPTPSSSIDIPLAGPAGAPAPRVGGKKGKKARLGRSRLGGAAAPAPEDTSSASSDAGATEAGSSLGSSPCLGTPLPHREPPSNAGQTASDADVDSDCGGGGGAGGRHGASEGWSDADDLAALVLDDPPRRLGGCVAGSPAPASPVPASPGRTCVGVQTDDAGGEPGSHPHAHTTACSWAPAAAGVGGEDETDDDDRSTSLGSWDEALIPRQAPLATGDGAEAFERVPLQRDCATQTRRGAPERRAALGAASAACWGGPAVGPTDDVRAVHAVFGPCRPAPLAAGGGGGPHAPPRPPTLLHAYCGVVFETLPGGHIAGVTLFAA